MPPVALSLTRDCAAIRIPSGEKGLLPAGTPVVLTQSLGGSYTVEVPALGGLFRIDGSDAGALGLEPAPPERAATSGPDGLLDEARVWEGLRTCYDPEIPVNIVDLGLVYDVRIEPRPEGGSALRVKMTLTAPGCGMGTAIAADARQKLERIPGVAGAEVEVVWDPPWSADMMSPEAKRRLGIP